MADRPSVRPAEADDVERIHELVESSMTTSYALSPQEIEGIVDTVFAESELRDRIENADSVVLVGEVDGVLAGVVEGVATDGVGEIRWLHVDPERRGGGLGTALFEAMTSEFDDRGVEETRAVALEANNTAGAFFERFDFAKTDEHQTDVGDVDVIEYEYAEADRETVTEDDASEGAAAESSAADEADSESLGDESDAEYPDSITTDDGEKLYLGEEPFRGSEGLFTATFRNEDRSEQYGYYCLNCGSADVSMDNMERVQCGNCGNLRKPDDEYDDSYL